MYTGLPRPIYCNLRGKRLLSDHRIVAAEEHALCSWDLHVQSDREDPVADVHEKKGWDGDS